MYNIFMLQCDYEERFNKPIPSWYLAEKYYNCADGWNILRKIFC